MQAMANKPVCFHIAMGEFKVYAARWWPTPGLSGSCWIRAIGSSPEVRTTTSSCWTAKPPGRDGKGCGRILNEAGVTVNKNMIL